MLSFTAPAAERKRPAPAKEEDGGVKDKEKDNDNDNDNDNEKEENDGDHDWYENLPAYGEHKRAVSSVQLAPSRYVQRPSAVAASASADGTAKVWDLQHAHTGSRRLLDHAGQCVGHARGINALSWNPVSPILATASDDKLCKLWDAVTCEQLAELRGHDNFVFCVDQHIHTVVTGSFDETVKLWDLRTGECVATLPAHSDPVTAVSFNRDGTTVATASHDGLIRIWDVATSECLKTLYAAGNPPVSSVTYSPNGKYVLAGTLDSTLRLWPVTSTTSSSAVKQYRDNHFVNSKYSVVADFMYDGNIVVGSETGHVVIFDLQTSRVRQVLTGHDDAVLAVSAHDRLPVIATGAMTTDRRVEFWRADMIKGHSNEMSGSSKRTKKK